MGMSATAAIGLQLERASVVVCRRLIGPAAADRRVMRQRQTLDRAAAFATNPQGSGSRQRRIAGHWKSERRPSSPVSVATSCSLGTCRCRRCRCRYGTLTENRTAKVVRHAECQIDRLADAHVRPRAEITSQADTGCGRAEPPLQPRQWHGHGPRLLLAEALHEYAATGIWLFPLDDQEQRAADVGALLLGKEEAVAGGPSPSSTPAGPRIEHKCGYGPAPTRLLLCRRASGHPLTAAFNCATPGPRRTAREPGSRGRCAAQLLGCRYCVMWYERGNGR